MDKIEYELNVKEGQELKRGLVVMANSLPRIGDKWTFNTEIGGSPSTEGLIVERDYQATYVVVNVQRRTSQRYLSKKLVEEIPLVIVEKH